MESRYWHKHIVPAITLITIIVITIVCLALLAATDHAQTRHITTGNKTTVANPQKPLAIKILDEQPTIAKESIGSGATASFAVSRTLEQSQTEVAKNLSKSGFVLIKQPVEDGDDKNTINHVTEMYAADKTKLVVEYTLANKLTCTPPQVCGPSKVSQPLDQQYDVSRLANEKLRQIAVTYQ